MTEPFTVACPGTYGNGCGALLPVTDFGGMCYACGAAFLDDELLNIYLQQNPSWMEADA
jgi:hypothetical protein